MAIAPTLQHYLDQQHIPYKLVFHPYAETAMGCAIAAKIPPRRVAKSVVLQDDEGFVMAIVPSDKQVDLQAVNHHTNRLLSTAKQRDVNLLFRDCTRGAVPGLGQPYNMELIWDDRLADEPECYLECGDHEELLYLNKDAFMRTMQDMPHGMISQ